MEQENIFEEVERFRIQKSNFFERHDFLRQLDPQSAKKNKKSAANNKFLKFPKATKNTLKDWLYDNQDNPYP